jgi:hypothetical protein
MSELVQTISSSLLRLVAQAVEFLPSFIVAIAILIIT